MTDVDARYLMSLMGHSPAAIADIVPGNFEYLIGPDRDNWRRVRAGMSKVELAELANRIARGFRRRAV